MIRFSKRLCKVNQERKSLWFPCFGGKPGRDQSQALFACTFRLCLALCTGKIWSPWSSQETIAVMAGIKGSVWGRWRTHSLTACSVAVVVHTAHRKHLLRDIYKAYTTKLSLDDPRSKVHSHFGPWVSPQAHYTSKWDHAKFWKPWLCLRVFKACKRKLLTQLSLSALMTLSSYQSVLAAFTCKRCQAEDGYTCLHLAGSDLQRADPKLRYHLASALTAGRIIQKAIMFWRASRMSTEDCYVQELWSASTSLSRAFVAWRWRQEKVMQCKWSLGWLFHTEAG